VDYEGLRVLLPTSTPVNIPSPQFQAATLANIGATDPAQLPFYQQMFSLWNSAPTAGNFTKEWLLTGRVDQNIGANDRASIHFRTDHGLQATYTDPINSVFNAQSDQPQYEGQLSEIHTFGSNSVNQFILSGSWYSAIFKPQDMTAATAMMPYRFRKVFLRSWI